MSSKEQAPSGKCIIVSAPSGAGKTTIVRHLLKQNLGLAFSVSATSREPRANEVDGEAYHFLTVDRFQERIKAGDFVEWEEVYPGKFYGTLQAEVERIWDRGEHVIFDVDVVGGLALKKHFGKKALSIFIEAPSIKVLEDRLRYRSSESEETIKERIGKASEEMARAPEFDIIITNDELELAQRAAVDIVHEFLQL